MKLNFHGHEYILWEKIADIWWQKKVINCSGKVKFEYYYLRKSGDKCNCLEIKNKIFRRYCGFKLIEKDIRDCLSVVREMNKNSSNKVITKYILRSLSVTYAKFFYNSKGRSAKLGVEILKGNKKLHDLHEFLIKMRHKYVAHSDVSEHEDCRSVLLIPPFKKFKKGSAISVVAYELQQSITFKDGQYLLFELFN